MGLFDGLAEAREQKKTEGFMRAALKEAQKAYDMHEVPIGCVIVKDGKVLAKACNKRNHDKSVLSHAEILAIQAACKKIKDWRLEDCTMYVTLEPCPMCAGASAWTQISRIVYGAADPKRGFATLGNAILHPRTTVTAGIMADECAQLVKDFFKQKRG